MRFIRPIAPVARLRHASDDTDDQRWLGRLAILEPAEARPDLLLGALAHAARVVEHDIRLFQGRREAVSQRAQLIFNQLGIEHVHLTAKSFEVDFLHGAVV